MSVDLAGGWNSDFTSVEGFSTLVGSLVLGGGSVNIKNIVIGG